MRSPLPESPGAGAAIFGALGNLLLRSLFSVDRLSLHLTLAGILAYFIGLVIFLIAAMDDPYRGEFSVSAEPFEMLLKGAMSPTAESPIIPRPTP